MRPYADRMQELMVGHRARRCVVPQSRACCSGATFGAWRSLVVTGDRGLAGPFNGQVLRRAFELERSERADGPRGGMDGHRPEEAPRHSVSAATS